MNRPDLIALGLAALVVGAVASTAQTTPPPSGGGSGRTLPPSTAQHAFAARDGVQVRSAPSTNASVEGTFGRGTGFLVGPEAIPGWFPIVREWVEGNARITRDLAYIAATDITFADPGSSISAERPLLGQSPSPSLGGGPVNTSFSSPAAVQTIGTSPTVTAAVASSTPLLGRTDGGECDLFVNFTWPHGVDDFKARLDTLFSATNETVVACDALSQSQKNEWAVFLAQWRQFAATPTSTFGSGTDWNTTCAYSRTLDGWRDVLATTQCSVIGPTSVHGYELPGSVGTGLGDLATVVKWGSLAVGGTVLLATFYPEIREGLGAWRSGRAARAAARHR